MVLALAGDSTITRERPVGAASAVAGAGVREDDLDFAKGGSSIRIMPAHCRRGNCKANRLLKRGKVNCQDKKLRQSRARRCCRKYEFSSEPFLRNRNPVITGLGVMCAAACEWIRKLSGQVPYFSD